jgi:hypothetical protein
MEFYTKSFRDTKFVIQVSDFLNAHLIITQRDSSDFLT